MIATNKTVIDKEKSFKDLVNRTRKQHLYKSGLIPLIFIGSIIILISGFESSDEDSIAVGIAALIIGLIYVIYNLITFLRIPKKVYKQNKIVCDYGMTYEYKFKEHSIIVTCIQFDKTNKLEYKYDSVKKILEYDDRYEIVLKENYILFIYKNGFDKDMEQFFIKNLSINKKKIKDKTKKKD